MHRTRVCFVACLYATDQSSRTKVFKTLASGGRHRRARPRELCASTRTEGSTRPSSLTHPAAHTRSAAQESLHTPSLIMMMPTRRAGPVEVVAEWSVVLFLLGEHRNHRWVPSGDCLCDGTCRDEPCAQRKLAPCHRGAPRYLPVPREGLRAL